MALLYVMIGGAIGSGLRYGMQILMPVTNDAFPFGTFLINVSGSFVIGIVGGLLAINSISREGVLFLAVGLCGGFTTFSTFSIELMNLIQAHRIWLAVLYALASTVLSVVAAFAGYLAIKH
ncbi:MAG: fluoride efflux transporter CrcB [bacterium]|nr:fluoride efflux transporter CrcB [bacterium]